MIFENGGWAKISIIWIIYTPACETFILFRLIGKDMAKLFKKEIVIKNLPNLAPLKVGLRYFIYFFLYNI